MHTFVDASEAGFAAISYLRIIKGNFMECSFAAAKTKVAPLKFLSIPRSELQAAVVGVRIANTVRTSLSTAVQRRFFWSDSKDVLCWIGSDHRKYNQFVACRVNEILESTEIDEWRWVPTNENVADDGTKWAKEPVFDSTSRWWRGPEFLWSNADKWPKQQERAEMAITTNELRVQVNYHKSTLPPLIDPSLFSEWTKLVRHTALVIRFVKNLKRKMKGERLELATLTGDELNEGETHLYKTAQQAKYGKEIFVLVVE
ncbi:uncharacterized protein LOC131293676 [Anopheles ziemanni]|uniref:uncharacterized protein LOC131264460 n=1 Tax=Anopheles coustani TaxID=139045 RepID=UPI00265A0D08|nr:uncharacterized protein LOC131264460 [Anopheles coustani]XP_058177734.1 uncharacterized protein LOC131293676 [Anopheles ziemanni]